MLINGYKFLYDGAEVAFIKKNKEFSLEYFKNFFKQDSTFYFSLNHNLHNENYVVVDLLYFSSENIIENYFPEINFEDIKNAKSYKFLVILKSLMNGNGYVDLCDFKSIFASLCETISSRNYECFKSFLCNYKRNKLICFFILRDLIENIKVYIYLLFDGIDKHITNDMDNFGDSSFQRKIDELNGTEKLKFNFKKIVNCNPKLKVYSSEFDKVEKINDICNNYIHKNGYSKMDTHFLRNIDENILLDYMYFLLKLYFSIIVSFDGKNISSSDYIYYLDMGVNPPENSQYWVAPIYEDFIKCEFSEKEINKMKENSYMLI